MRRLVLLIVLALIIGGVVVVGSAVAKYLPAIVLEFMPRPSIEEVALEHTEAGNESQLPLILPEGFSISVFAEGLGSPRDIAYDLAGNLIVSIPKEGRVVALPDRNGDGVADEHVKVVDGLKEPHGLATYCEVDGLGLEGECFLYIAETDAVARYRYDREALRAFDREVLFGLPWGDGHSTRSLLVTPPITVGEATEPRLLISVGSSCNVCFEEDKRRATILSASLDGSDVEIFAEGMRNAVFMETHPVTGEIWASENGRDLLGDNIPPDEINIVRTGENYGWPICYGKQMHDGQFDTRTYVRNPCEDTVPSHIDIQAHSAPLGLAFVPEEGWGEEYWYDLLVAYHGSWNRSEKTGYKIVRFMLDSEGNLSGREDFITGWLREDGEVWGRPVDVLIQPGGVMYITDDFAGVIYRVTRS